MNNRLDAFCGLYCGACEIFLANVNGTVDALAKEEGITPEDLVCNGCKTDVNSIYCRTCIFKKCMAEKKLEFCSDCTEYPCKKIKDFRYDKSPHHSIVLQNLDFIKKNGVEKWLEKQRNRWSCPACGIQFSWYAQKCGNCEKPVFNCRKEEKDLRE